jgi:hypothetical protein
VASVDQTVAAVGETSAKKNDAVIGFGRMKDDLDVSP